ncbi:MAG: hypothetical protein PHR21_02100 [Oscillospiraceae bacterium]|nr:hypothetical protein [Oscillospiraceae bacterium]MDD4368213.1 hypothetical protein [Oscillospiraceae bacterium]
MESRSTPRAEELTDEEMGRVSGGDTDNLLGYDESLPFHIRGDSCSRFVCIRCGAAGNGTAAHLCHYKSRTNVPRGNICENCAHGLRYAKDGQLGVLCDPARVYTV